jgi:predicted dehydrogenase
VKSAQAAVERYGLPSTTKTYGSSEDLAKDPDVDLVVCNVRVDRHYQLMMPVLKAGKDAFVEWPLGSNLQQAEEMLAAAKASGSKTIVGLQARSSPVTQKIKQLVEEKVIGDLLSSVMTYYVGFLADVEPPGIDYLAKKAVGGNLMTILFSHMADPAYYSLGGLRELSALLTTVSAAAVTEEEPKIKQVLQRWPKTKLLHTDGTFDKLIDRETADHVMVQGLLKSGAPILIYVRGGKAFKDTPALTWQIFGTKGEIRVTSMASIGVAVGGDKVELYDHEKDNVEIVDVQFDAAVRDLPPLAKNIGMLYELFATGGTVEEGLVTFEEAVGMHKILDAMERSDAERKYEKISS